MVTITPICVFTMFHKCLTGIAMSMATKFVQELWSFSNFILEFQEKLKKKQKHR